ncbi:TPA: hypothetical protein TZW74_001731 [Streptococcus suis]|nr:hypothetical protein [Streptococcus suis]
MKQFFERLKTYFNIENSSLEVIPDSAKKWKALALDLNTELQKTRKLHAKALDENLRLKRICECQGELLAERGE